MNKIRFKDYCLQFFAQLWKDVRHKPLECLAVIASVLMLFMSMFTTLLVLRQNAQISNVANDLS